MLKLINIELYKIFTQKRSYIGLAAILVIVLVAQGAMLWEGQAMHEFITKNLSDAFFMYGNLVNGYLISFLVLNFLWVHVPLLVVIVTGDIFSGEAQSGTFRLLLTRPVSRSGLVTAKFIAGIVYTFVLMIFFAIISLGISLIWFGKGDLMVIFNSVSILPEDDLLWRFILAYVYGFIGMTAIAALSMLFSAMANNSLGPILTTMAIIILFTMISSFNLSIFAAIQPFLITSYLDSWQLVFSFEVDTGQIIFDASMLLLHILVFYFITLVYFNRKDILT
ncbi:MAG TPA: ABC transporter permease subunit [Bacteroidales bacterium]|nr:ABC transporter permease subunit [Bacteroidales bacterium]HRX96106.1 ABC transporter permease subunit [Bacteroidales bacterium]